LGYPLLWVDNELRLTEEGLNQRNLVGCCLWDIVEVIGVGTPTFPTRDRCGISRQVKTIWQKNKELKMHQNHLPSYNMSNNLSSSLE